MPVKASTGGTENHLRSLGHRGAGPQAIPVPMAGDCDSPVIDPFASASTLGLQPVKRLDCGPQQEQAGTGTALLNMIILLQAKEDIMRFSTMIAALFLILAAIPAAQAQDGTQKVQVELNKLEPQANACRAYLVLQNGTESEFSSLRLDLVAFDTDGIVAKRLAVEAAPLPPGKTSLKLFDMSELACDGIGHLLLNSVLACGDQNGERADCLDLIDVTAKPGLSLIK